MSFILDALKKSEIERQRQSVPGLMDTRAAQRRNRLPGWALGLGVLLGINLLVLTFTLTRKSAPAAPAAPAARPADAAMTAPQTEAPPPSPQHFSPLDAAPEFAPEIPVAAQSPIQPPVPREAHRAHHSDPLLTDPDAGPQIEELLPSINEVSLSGSQALPELHLDVHVYATKPSERFVYINMRKYHEGATLQEGPALERIRRDGVVLNYHGLRFLLPRQP